MTVQANTFYKPPDEHTEVPEHLAWAIAPPSYLEEQGPDNAILHWSFRKPFKRKVREALEIQSAPTRRECQRMDFNSRKSQMKVKTSASQNKASTQAQQEHTSTSSQSSHANKDSSEKQKLTITVGQYWAH